MRRRTKKLAYWAESLPANKTEWRRGFAVLEDWNKNGSYIEYTVPEGGLNVWSGRASSQTLEDAAGWIQPGGEVQLFVPKSKELIPSEVNKIPTDWED